VAVNAFLSFFDKANGESTLRGRERGVELHGWDWEIEAATSWTKGGGASVGKPVPGAMRWQHDFDASSPTIMAYICTGKSFPKVQLDILRPTAAGAAAAYVSVLMEGVFITKVSNSLTEEGGVAQGIEMVFKTIKIDYTTQDPKGGRGSSVATFNWDIPSGTVSPSA
jgi:type VI secretion system secreted protein Hcp